MAVIININKLSGLRQQVLAHFRALGHSRDPIVTFVSGNFNIIHPGHQRLIQFAAECGDVLCVAVHPDTVAGVMIPQNLRMEGLRAITAVDYVIPMTGEIESVITALKPDFVVKGKEHEGKANLEEEILKKTGGKLLFGSGESNFSSIDLLRKDFENIQHSTIQQPKDYLIRHGIHTSKLSEAIHDLKGLKVLVIGETIVDEYVTCEALGLSQEDPTIVVTPIHRKKFVGGAAIVAAHAAGLGADVQFVSVVGHDANAQFASENLKNFKVKHRLFEDKTRPTTLKQRFRSKDKTLLRVNEVRQHSIAPELAEQILLWVSTLISDLDLIVMSDFNYGVLPTPLVREITKLGEKHGVIMVADSQSSSQIGDVSRFTNMKLLTPTEREARLGVSDFESGLVVLADKLIHKSSAENVFVTMGSEGVFIRATAESISGDLVTDQLPAFNFAPKDPAGAGDSLLITSSLCLARGYDIWTSAYLGSLAAAIQVSRVGNTPLNANDLMVELRTVQVHSGAAS